MNMISLSLNRNNNPHSTSLLLNRESINWIKRSLVHKRISRLTSMPFQCWEMYVFHFILWIVSCMSGWICNSHCRCRDIENYIVFGKSWVERGWSGWSIRTTPLKVFERRRFGMRSFLSPHLISLFIVNEEVDFRILYYRSIERSNSHVSAGKVCLFLSH